MVATALIYAAPRITWNPQLPYYNLLFIGLPDLFQAAVVISRVYGDFSILVMANCLMCIASVIQFRHNSFLADLRRGHQNDIWDVIEKYKEIVKMIQRFSSLTQQWLLVHCLLFLVSIGYSCWDVYRTTQRDDHTVPVHCMVKDLGLFLFVLVVPFFSVAQISKDCKRLIAQLSNADRDELPELLQQREQLHMFVQYLEWSDLAFTIFGIPINPKVANLSLVAGVGSSIMTCLRLRISHGPA